MERGTEVRYKFEQSGDIGTLSLKGSLGIGHAPVLKDVLMRAIENTWHLALDLKGVAHVDPACLRILCSACRVASSRNKCITLTGLPPKAFQPMPGHAGHFTFLGCGVENEQECFYRAWGAAHGGSAKGRGRTAEPAAGETQGAEKQGE
jgi:anti-anti-sigma factor